jgi:hypothetical protein
LTEEGTESGTYTAEGTTSGIYTKKIQNREEGSMRSGTGVKCAQHHDLGKRADRIKNKEGVDGIRN